MTDYINAPDPKSPLDIRPVTGRIGGEVLGVKLSNKLAAEDVKAVRAALARHKVLFFRDQDHLDDDSQEAFGAHIGKLVPHPTVPVKQGSKVILDLDSTNGQAANSWHTDVTFVDAYPEASILRGVTIPEAGGDTLFANTVTAYNALPEQLRGFVDSAWALHTNEYDYAAYFENAPDEQKKYYASVFASTVYQTEHPLVRVHPETGERSLLAGHFIKKILGLGNADSQRIFQILQEHITSPENTVRWRWRQNDVVIWDNRATQHRAVADFGTQRRTVRRVTLDGPVPVAIDGRRSRTLSAEKAKIAA